MTYRFAGHITAIDGALCWLHMADQTDRTRPDEEWCVARARLRGAEVGQYVTFTVSPRGGRFWLDARRWTAKELAAAKARAEHWRDVFRETPDAQDTTSGVRGGQRSDRPT